MAPIPPPPPDPVAEDDGLPDLSHLSEEERQIILQVLQRQKAEEQQEEEIAQKGDRELWDIERQIQEKKENAQRLIGTQDDAICQICQKTKFADGIGHKCFYCQLRSCARCGGRTTSKSKNIWACSLCQKRQQILAKTGKWFQQQKEQSSQQSKTANSATPSPLAPSSPSPTETENPQQKQQPGEQRRQSLQPSQAGSGGLLASGRQSATTLHRQSSLEEEQQSVAVNGDHRMAATAGGADQQGPARTNGQMRKTQQRTAEELPPRGGQRSKVGGDVPRQESAPQQPISRHHASPRAHHGQQQQPRPSTAGRIRASESQHQASQQRQQRSMEENISSPQQGRHLPRASTGEHQPSQQRVAAAAFVPAVPGQPPPTQGSSRQPTISAATGYGGGPSPMRARRSKLVASSRHTRSYSSSDDELSSPKQQAAATASSQPAPARQPPLATEHSPRLPQSSSALQLETGGNKAAVDQLPDFSEKELLRYIYESAHPSARRAAATSRGGPYFGQQTHHHSLDVPAAGGFSAPMSLASAPTASGSSSAQQQNALARRIRNYLSNPAVSWQPSADQRRLIGHMVLHKPSSLAPIAVPNQTSSASVSGGFSSSLDFGVKVAGGRNRSTGRLGAFVSRVRPGSVADTVGQLRAGDEVLEWNGHSLQNVTPEAVYNIVQCTKGDFRLELIVSRPVAGGGDDFLNMRRLRADAAGGQQLSHSQSMTAAYSPFGLPRGGRRPASPMVLHSAGASLPMGSYFEPIPALPFFASDSGGTNSRICGRLEVPLPPTNNVHSQSACQSHQMALLYLAQKRELIISLSRAHNLVPRPDGSARNPFVKLFLLPDRSERSRRQSKVLTETLNPVWDEHFFYEDMDEGSLQGRVLEITLWDYDESHSFLGETLVELARAPLNNQPFLYNLVDMDEENPLRMRLRQRRYSSMTPPTEHRSRSQMSYPGQQHSSYGESFEERRPAATAGWNNSQSVQNLPGLTSRSRHGGGVPLAIGAEAAFWSTAEEDWNRNEAGAGEEGDGGGFFRAQPFSSNRAGRVPNGYLSDQDLEWELERRRREHHRRREHRHQHHSRGEHHQGGGREHRRPQSATALRNIAEWEMRHGGPGSSVGNGHQSSGELFDSATDRQPRHSAGANRRATRPQELREQEGGGYGSDGSVETLSVNSAQSMQNRTLLRQQQIQRIREHQQHISQQSSNEDINDPRAQMMGLEDEEEERPDRGSHQGVGPMGMMKGGQPLSVKEMKERKKSLMTRLIPGRNGPNDANKRLGFARSEEVGIPGEMTALAPPEQNREFIKQNSKESTDSSDNWLPILPDRPLGSFMDNLGPGQVVGRQALGSSPLGELHVGISVEQGTGLVVDVREARKLKLGPKGVPASYVKAYLMDGKNCVAKAKTQPSKNPSASPMFRQKLVFAENPLHKMLQLTVIGDFGRMERKAFLGVAQVALDELQLGREPLDGWFKLFHSASLNGSAAPPGASAAASRKGSEVSLVG